MKNIFTILLLALLHFSVTHSQVTKPGISSRSENLNNGSNGIKLPNIDRLKSKDLKKLKIPVVSITEAQKNAKPLSSWVITPTKPRYSSLSIDSYYGEYSLKGWKLEPKPQFEGPDFNGFYLSALTLNFRVSRGVNYLIRVKLKETRNNWYEGKYVLAAAMNNSFARYPIDARNNEILIPFTANSSGNKRISISNIIINDKLYAYTIEKISITKIQ